MASADLIWGIVRENNSFLVKRKKVQFTSEPNNLSGLNSFKYSGLANENSVGIVGNGKVLTMTVKTSKVGKPVKAQQKIALNTARGPKVLNKVVESQIEKVYYRKDLALLAKARYAALHKAFNKKSAGVEYKHKKRSNKN